MKQRDKRIASFLQSLDMEELNGEIQATVLNLDQAGSGASNTGKTCTNNHPESCSTSVNVYDCYNQGACNDATNMGKCHNLPSRPPVTEPE